MKIKLKLSLLILIASGLLFCQSSFAADYSYTERYVDNTLYSGTKPTGTATGGGNDYILLEAGSEGTDDLYNNYGILLLTGTGAGQCKRIIDYDATGNGNGECYAQVDSAWATNPDATTTYEITVGSDANNGAAEGVYGGTNGAWRTIQYAADTCTAGYRMNIKAGREYDITTTIDFDTNIGNEDNQIVIQGYGSSVGDGTRAIIDGQSTATYCFNGDATYGQIFADLEFKGATSDAVYKLDAAVVRCKVTTAGEVGLRVDGYSKVIGNEVTGFTTYGIYGHSCTGLIYNYSHDGGGYGIYFGSQIGYAVGNIIDTIDGNGIRFNHDNNGCLENTIYNVTGDAYVSDGDEWQIVINNIFDTVGGDGVQTGLYGWIRVGGYNVFHSITGLNFNSNNYQFNLGGDVTDDPQFENAAGADFNLGALDNSAYPQDGSNNFPGTSTTQTNEIGAMSYEETGGGGGGTHGGCWTNF